MARMSDDEYVETLRRSIATCDRWRFWLILLQLGLLVTVSVVFSSFIPNLLRFVKPGNAPFALLGFIMGTLVGMSFGWLIHGILNTLRSVLSGLRCERLLIKYYDTINQVDDVDSDSSELESEESRRIERHGGRIP